MREDLAAGAATTAPAEATATAVATNGQVSAVTDPKPLRAPFGVLFWICVGWLGGLVFVTVFASLLPLDNPTYQYFGAGVNAPITMKHWLGTDGNEYDVLARLIFAIRTSLIIGLAATAIGVSIGSTLGMLSAYLRGRFDAALSFFMYCGLAFPAIIAVIAIITFWGQAEWHIIIVLGLFSVPLIFRLVRAVTLQSVTKEFVTAAKSQGATAWRVVFHDIIPSVLPSLIAYSIFTLGGVIAVEGALAFLGFSVPPPNPTWGGMINDAGNDLSATLVFILVPSACFFLTLFSLNFAAERVRVHFDPGETRL